MNRLDVVTEYYNLELLYKDSLNIKYGNQLGESAKFMIDKTEHQNSELKKVIII